MSQDHRQATDHRFVWTKRDSQQRPGSLSADDQRRRAQDIQSEIDKVKRRRVEREANHHERERQKDREVRNRENANVAEWEEKDNQFFRNQDMLAIQIRLKEGRAKPLDKLYKLIYKDAQYPIRQDALQIIKNLNPKELEEVESNIEKYSSLEEGGKIYWDALRATIQNQRQKLKDREGKDAADDSISKDIKSIFEGKDYNELVDMERQIEDNQNGDEAAIPEYWDSVLKKLRVRKAKIKLAELKGDTTAPQGKTVESVYNEDDIVEEYVPTPRQPDPRRAALEREAQRLRAKAQGNREEKIPTDEEMLKREANIVMEQDEEAFNTETKLDKTYDYVARKPKYFNRVQTGHDWNRYNQTHYDEDNPPPKIVLGYTFNIFYPDLADVTKTPSYKILPAESPDYVLILFHAGPPYEVSHHHNKWLTGIGHWFYCGEEGMGALPQEGLSM
ncbi:hypothetical protein PROFUN_14526 [Planoprotostelium fungivorum]|uniref:Splicing factor Cactin n=1 Tax=Planoprotostelium fungivorum TaxID=1890364 RepID=A0A2P6N6L0_9EUKA|nr:hypothetical protein PROFUN_14526 [Planoprotostelium fungivorum]